MARPSFEVEAKISVADLDELTRNAVKEFSKELESKERENIAAAGMARFARRTTVRVFRLGQSGWEIQVLARPNWMRAWEFGFTSVGRPMLWMPAPDTGKRRRAKTWLRLGRGKRRLIRPKGKNVLINAATGQVLYIGIPRTQGGPKLSMRQIAEEEAERFVEQLGYKRRA